MLKQALSSIRFAHFGLACVGLMWALPFLCPIHRIPLTTFYQEWGAAVLGLCAMPLLVMRRYWQQPEIPRIVLLPIGLMLLVVVQFIAGKMDYFSQALLVALYLLWVALLIMLGRCLREELGMPLLATVLAAFLLLGAELNTLAGLVQHFHWHGPFDRMVVIDSHGVFGNMGQPNHFADYVSLGLASLGLLYMRRQLRPWQVALLALPMLFVLPLSGSRSPWMYLSCFALMAFFWQRRDKSSRPLLYYCLLLLLGMILMQLAVLHVPWLAGHGGETTFDRMSQAVTGIEGGAHGGPAVQDGAWWRRSIRLQVWYDAWLIFTKFPLLGAGFGQFGWQHFLLGPSQHNPLITGLYNNAHNLVMQTAAEMGLAGLLVLFITLSLWIRQLYRAPRTIYHWWGGGILIVLAIHSLLEYPLWYAYFLGVAALTLGMLDGTTYKLELRNAGRLSVSLILLLGVLSLAQLWQGYRAFEKLSNTRPTSMKKDVFIDKLMKAHRQVLLQPYVEFALSGLIEIIPDKLAIERELNENVMHFLPVSLPLYREVTLLALSGEQEAAQAQLERAIWAYPGSFPKYLERWSVLAKKDPEHFAALLEFGNKKFEEYKRAVHAE